MQKRREAKRLNLRRKVRPNPQTDFAVASAIVGASRPEQITELVGALSKLDFTADELTAIDTHAVEGGINLWQRPSTDQRPS